MDEIFEYKGWTWLRKADTLEFFCIRDIRGWPAYFKCKPHKYFEAYTAMKNEEAKKWLRSQETAN